MCVSVGVESEILYLIFSRKPVHWNRREEEEEDDVRDH
jgi:hypothetical protein